MKFYQALTVICSALIGAAPPLAAQSSGGDNWDRSVLPVPMTEFKGHVGLRTSESTLDFPRQVTAPEGAPNILLIMPDDVGFGAPTAFGGPVPTEAYDRLAKDGLLFTQMHTTALCSPTRSALITGRNHHSNSTGVIMELGTAWYGKNHNVPDWQSSQAGPFDLWPTGLGFELVLWLHRRQHQPVHSGDL